MARATVAHGAAPAPQAPGEPAASRSSGGLWWKGDGWKGATRNLRLVWFVGVPASTFGRPQTTRSRGSLRIRADDRGGRYFELSYGEPVPDEPRKSTLPSASFISHPFARNAPSLA